MRMVDYPKQIPIETILLLDTIKANLVLDVWRGQPFVSGSVKDYEAKPNTNNQKVKSQRIL
jgi:hypothetical protein